MFGRKKVTEEQNVPKKPTLIDKMQESKRQHGIALINVFNDGLIGTDKEYATVMMKYANDKDAFDYIGKYMYEVNEAYSRECDYDTLNFQISLGLLFSGKDADENQKLKKDAQPIDGIVRYYQIQKNRRFVCRRYGSCCFVPRCSYDLLHVRNFPYAD